MRRMGRQGEFASERGERGTEKARGKLRRECERQRGGNGLARGGFAHRDRYCVDAALPAARCAQHGRGAARAREKGRKNLMVPGTRAQRLGLRVEG